MLKLIKLEIKKFKLYGELRGVAVSYLYILGLVLMVSFSIGQDGKYENIIVSNFEMIRILSEATFLIYSSSILAKLVVDEYKNKTIMTMFMYPINRKKLIAAKMIIVWMFTFLSIILANLIIGGILILINDNFRQIWTDKLTTNLILKIVLNNICITFFTSFISFIPLIFGMIKKSVSSTVISSFIVTMIVSSIGAGGTRVEYNFIILKNLFFGLIGILILCIIIMKLEKYDLLN